LVLALIYLANGRDIGTDDTYSATLLPLNILRGEGVYLGNRYHNHLPRNFPVPYFWTKTRGQIVTLYPIAPALVALPFVAVQVVAHDWIEPDWDVDPKVAVAQSHVMVKRSMAVIVALAGVIFHHLLLVMGLRRSALIATVAAFLGSDLWTVGSQAAWQHGPAAFALVAAIALIHSPRVSRVRFAIAGLATGTLFACRLMDIVFAVAMVGWLACVNRRALLWFLPGLLAIGISLLLYNLWFFGSVVGGQAEIERHHRQLHAVAGTWTGDMIEGACGTLFSPNRGLLAFSPWIAIGLVSLIVPAVRRQLAAHSLIATLTAALVPYLIILSKYSVWWGGHCFGPRYWTDVVPLFAILFAFALDWMWQRSRVLVAAAAVPVVFSIAVQTVGAFCYPSTWNSKPVNVDIHHERLWDWRDTEIRRCLLEIFFPPRR
jgi:hypothetical protein